MKKAIIYGLFLSLFAGCYYHNEEELYPGGGQVCDTTAVTYSGSVLPVLQANCMICHSTSANAANGGSINLEDFSLLKDLVDGGNLYGAITHSPLHVPMPKDRAKLDTCSISKIKIWIDGGAINN